MKESCLGPCQVCIFNTDTCEVHTPTWRVDTSPYLPFRSSTRVLDVARIDMRLNIAKACLFAGPQSKGPCTTVLAHHDGSHHATAS